MADSAALDAEERVVPTRLQLFLGFFRIGVLGFGGVGPWARRILTEDRRWLTEREYAETFGLCQILPGATMVNMALLMGDRLHGLSGAALAMLGMFGGPMLITLGLAYLYDTFGTLPLVSDGISGVASAAAGLFLGTALRMATRLNLSVPALAIAACGFIAVGFLRLPLLPVMLVLTPIGMVITWREVR